MYTQRYCVFVDTRNILILRYCNNQDQGKCWWDNVGSNCDIGAYTVGDGTMEAGNRFQYCTTRIEDCQALTLFCKCALPNEIRLGEGRNQTG